MTSTYFQEHKNMVLTLARDYFPVPEDAEDAMQEVFIKLNSVRNRAPSSSEERASWVYAVTENLMRDLKRRERVRSRADEWVGMWVDEVVDHDDPLTLLEREEAVAAFVAGWETLTPPLLEVMQLRYEEGKSYEEIAEQLGLAVGTVGSRIARAREVLQV